MGPDRWAEVGHMEAWGESFQVKGIIYSINIYRALTQGEDLPVGAGDTQMALASKAVMDSGGQVHRQIISNVVTR